MKLKICAFFVAAALTGCNTNNENPADGNNGQPYNAPIASSVAITGDALIGSTITGKYTFTDPNYSPREEGKSQFQWRQASAEIDGENDTVLGENQTLTLTDNELGQSVYFCVTPVAEGNVNIVGEEECSSHINIESGVGEKPHADNVAIDNTTPTVGDTLTGDYIYSDPDGDMEATSQFVWKSNDKDIIGATQQSFTLSATQEGTTIQFCVTPISENPEDLPNYPVTGDQTCSEATAPVSPKIGSAPVASNVTTSGDHTVGSVITGEYTFSDDDGDKEGDSELSWKRDGNLIPNENTNTYTLADDDKGNSIEFCVTPVSATGLPTHGNEVCAEPITNIGDPIGDIPSITLDTITSDDDIKYPKVGDTLTGSYQYQESDSGAADQSIAVWKAGDQVIESVSCTIGQPCNLVISDQQLGHTLSYCVTPKATDSQPGVEQCSSPLETFGIRISGKLEFNQTLNAEVFGYTNPQFSWRVDTANTEGPVGDSVRTEKETAQSYTIGQEVLANITPDFESNFGNNNGLTDDADWDQALRQGVVDANTINAAHYIGKDVELCVRTNEAAEQCLLASSQSGVSGGVIYNKDNFALRAIEPVREISFKGAVYHRPLSLAEMEADSGSDFGPLLPKADFNPVAMGIEWASLRLEHSNSTKPALDACLNLYKQTADDSTTWYLPASRSDSSYIPNAFELEGNILPVNDNSTYLIKLANIYNSKEGVVGQGLVGNLTGESSPIFGWVTKGDSATPYWSATKPTNDNMKANSVKFYDSGSSGNNDVTNGRFVSCVRAAG